MEQRETTPDAVSARRTESLEGRAEVLDAYLLGSMVTGDAQPHSDIDIAVYVDEEMCGGSGYGEQAELTTVLMSALGTNRIDVVILNHAPPLLYHRVLRDGTRIFARDLEKTTTREGNALSRYCDDVPRSAWIDAIRSKAGPGRPEE